MSDLRFHDEWHEDRAIDDGTVIRLRPIRPADQQRVAEGFSSLSPESKFLRCLRARQDLSARELHFMTDCDGIDHFAIAVLSLDTENQEDASVGLARFVRCLDDPSAAEIAITVLDEWQGRGVGRLLFHRLLAALAERGYTSARGVMHADNDAMRKLLETGGPEVQREKEDELVRFAIPVPAPKPWPLHLPEDAGRKLARMLKIARAGAVTLPLAYPVEIAETVLEDWRPHLDEFRERLGWIADTDAPSEKE